MGRPLTACKHLKPCRSIGLAAVLASITGLAACQGAGGYIEPSGQNQSGAAHLSGIRADNGLSPLSADSKLESAALEQAQYMANARTMEHTTGFRRSFDRRMAANNIGGAAAENIAHGAFGVDELFQRWMASPPHRRNMLNPEFTRFGLASVREADGKRRYWALVLAK